MAQRYGLELAEQMPELAAVLGAGWSADMERTILEALGGKAGIPVHSPLPARDSEDG